MAEALLLIGVALICTGVGLWSIPAACVTAGVFCCVFGLAIAARTPEART